MIIIIMKNLNGCCSHGHHGSKRCELVQHARGSHSDLTSYLFGVGSLPVGQQWKLHEPDGHCVAFCCFSHPRFHCLMVLPVWCNFSSRSYTHHRVVFYCLSHPTFHCLMILPVWYWGFSSRSYTHHRVTFCCSSHPTFHCLMILPVWRWDFCSRSYTHHCVTF